MNRWLFISFLLVAQLTWASDRNKYLMVIDVPMDNRSENERGHTSIKYILREPYEVTRVRWVESHAAQAIDGKQLTPSEFAETTNLLAQLPPSQTTLPADQILTIITFPPLASATNTYPRMNLPSQIERLLTLLGGIRFELEGKLKFNLEQGPPGYREPAAGFSQPEG